MDKEVANSKMKTAGCATYNMAIINKINGAFEAAIKWDYQSYTDYENKLALRFVNILKRRGLAKNQLKNQWKYRNKLRHCRIYS
jgi:hypothetical protein